MNRRTFLASLIAIPAAVKAVVSVPRPLPAPDLGYIPYNADARSIHRLLEECGSVVDQTGALDLDEIFNQVYALKAKRKCADLEPYTFVDSRHG